MIVKTHHLVYNYIVHADYILSMKKILPIPKCPVVNAVHALGGRWRLIILWQLRDGSKRFNELQRIVPGITQRMLVKELRDLEKRGIVARKVYAQIPPKVEYSLSRSGKDLAILLKELAAWSESYKI